MDYFRYNIWLLAFVCNIWPGMKRTSPDFDITDCPGTNLLPDAVAITWPAKEMLETCPVHRLPLRHLKRELFRTYCPRIRNISGIIKYDPCAFVHKAINESSYNVLRFGRRSHAYNTRSRYLFRQLVVNLTVLSRCLVSIYIIFL